MKTPAGWERELYWQGQDKKVIIGLDEVGRGCWAGPLVAAAYVFKTIPSSISVYDSKQTSKTERRDLIDSLKELGQWSIGSATAEEVDRLGLQEAQYTAYKRALSQFSSDNAIVLLDGREWKESDYECESIVKGDCFVASIAAASIVAKQFRDTHMEQVVHTLCPHHGFDRHVGYGTALHRLAIEAHGLTAEHRRSYKPIRAFLNRA